MAGERVTSEPGVGDAAPDVELLDQHDHTVRLSDLWTRRPLVLLLVRHLGCPFCRAHLADMRDNYARFEQAGGHAAAVAMATPAQAAAFATELKLPFPCLADPDRKTYHEFAAPRGSLWQIAGPGVWGAGLKAVLRGGMAKPVGDVRQLASTFVIDREGIVRFAHRPTDTADRPDDEAMLAVLASLPQGDR